MLIIVHKKLHKKFHTFVYDRTIWLSCEPIFFVVTYSLSVYIVSVDYIVAKSGHDWHNYYHELNLNIIKQQPYVDLITVQQIDKIGRIVWFKIVFLKMNYPFLLFMYEVYLWRDAVKQYMTT